MLTNKLSVLLYICVIFSLTSCKNNQTENNRESQDSITQDTLIVDTLEDVLEVPNHNILTADSTDFYYMISGLFDDRDSIRKEFPLVQKRKWNALTYVVDQRKFYLKPIQLDTVYWHDDCNGVDMLTIESVSGNKKQGEDTKPNEIEYIYLTDLNHRLGEIPSHFHKYISINPRSPYTFDFNGTKYTLRAEGKYSEYTARANAITKNYMGRLQNDVDGYDDYKLYLEVDGKTQLLNSGRYDSTCLEILFIGDLDGDGKPDFLFETNTWYEGSEVTLFLSSKADEGKLVKNMGASGNYYSC